MEKKAMYRIKEYIDYKGYTIRSFEVMAGLTNGNYGNQLKHDKTIGIDKLELILHTFQDMSAEYILRGQGEMIKSENSVLMVNESIPEYGIKKDLISALNERIKFQEEMIKELITKIK